MFWTQTSQTPQTRRSLSFVESLEGSASAVRSKCFHVGCQCHKRPNMPGSGPCARLIHVSPARSELAKKPNAKQVLGGWNTAQNLLHVPGYASCAGWATIPRRTRSGSLALGFHGAICIICWFKIILVSIKLSKFSLVWTVG